MFRPLCIPFWYSKIYQHIYLYINSNISTTINITAKNGVSAGILHNELKIYLRNTAAPPRGQCVNVASMAVDTVRLFQCQWSDMKICVHTSRKSVISINSAKTNNSVQIVLKILHLQIMQWIPIHVNVTSRLNTRSLMVKQRKHDEYG